MISKNSLIAVGAIGALGLLAWYLQRQQDATTTKATPAQLGSAFSGLGQWLNDFPGLALVGAVTGGPLGGNQLPPLTLEAIRAQGRGNTPVRLL